MSEDDLFWSLLSDEGGECEYAKREREIGLGFG